MTLVLNERQGVVSGPIKRRTHILVEFPEPRLECVIVQWEIFRPSVFVQLKSDAQEPIQFPGKRPEIPGNAELSKDLPSVLDFSLKDFVDASSGKLYSREAFSVDIVFSARAFEILQPEPDLVLPAQALWEARGEALQAMGILDAVGTELAKKS